MRATSTWPVCGTNAHICSTGPKAAATRAAAAHATRCKARMNPAGK